jgi:hypothetical protein
MVAWRFEMSLGNDVSITSDLLGMRSRKSIKKAMAMMQTLARREYQHLVSKLIRASGVGFLSFMMRMAVYYWSMGVEIEDDFCRASSKLERSWQMIPVSLGAFDHGDAVLCRKTTNGTWRCAWTEPITELEEI